ncbi:MAG: sulfotransferase [Psychrobacter sp.]|jgi:hypothetical protein
MNKFIIGIGSQRAGSTMLHKLIASCSDVYMHGIKELHYFDTKYDLRGRATLVDFSSRQLDREIGNLVNKDDLQLSKEYRAYLRANLILKNNDIDNIDYLDLFRPCLKDYYFLGEITPEYMLLPDEGVEDMKKVLGDDTKIIIIVRNPIDRIISAYKLKSFYGTNGKSYDINVSKGIKNELELNSQWLLQQDQFNNYTDSIKRFSKYFDNLLILSYEGMVSNPKLFVGKLACFLDVPFDSNKACGLLTQKTNSFGDMSTIDDHLYELLQERYKDSLELTKDIHSEYI